MERKTGLSRWRDRLVLMKGLATGADLTRKLGPIAPPGADV